MVKAMGIRNKFSIEEKKCIVQMKRKHPRMSYNVLSKIWTERLGRPVEPMVIHGAVKSFKNIKNLSNIPEIGLSSKFRNIEGNIEISSFEHALVSKIKDLLLDRLRVQKREVISMANILKLNYPSANGVVNLNLDDAWWNHLKAEFHRYNLESNCGSVTVINTDNNYSRTTRNQEKIQSKIAREERTMHTCYYDDVFADYIVNRGPADDCPICKYKNRLRVVRVSLNVSNAVCDNTLNITQQTTYSTTPIDIPTKEVQIKVPSISNDHLKALRKILPPVSVEYEREKSSTKLKTTMFQNDEILELNKRAHPNVSNILHYRRSTEILLDNRNSVYKIRKQKNEYRLQMLIEKSLGLYEVDQLIKNMETTNCHYCGRLPDDELSSKSDTFCNFCYNSLKEFHSSFYSIGQRKDERRNNLGIRMRYISDENRKPYVKKERNSYRCPQIVFNETLTDCKDGDQGDVTI